MAGPASPGAVPGEVIILLSVKPGIALWSADPGGLGREVCAVRDVGERVTVYGAAWCWVSVMTLRHLDELGVPYEMDILVA